MKGSRRADEDWYCAAGLESMKRGPERPRVRCNLSRSRSPRTEDDRIRVPEERPGEAAGEGAAQFQCRPQHFGDASTMG